MNVCYHVCVCVVGMKKGVGEICECVGAYVYAVCVHICECLCVRVCILHASIFLGMVV